MKTGGEGDNDQKPSKTAFGPWMVAQKLRWRPTRSSKGISGSSKDNGFSGEIQGGHNQQPHSKEISGESSLRLASHGAKIKGS